MFDYPMLGTLAQPTLQGSRIRKNVLNSAKTFPVISLVLLNAGEPFSLLQ
jgi:hypothetical protein